MKTIKQGFKNHKSKALAIVVLSTLGMSSAHAALDTAVTTMLSGITSDFGELTALLWPLAALVTGFFIVLGLARKGAKTAAR